MKTRFLPFPRRLFSLALTFAVTMVTMVPMATPLALAAGAAKASATETAMSEILTPYLAIQEALAGDDIGGVTKAAKLIEAKADAMKPADVAESGVAIADIKKAAGAVAAASGIENARKAFKELSVPLTAWARKAAPPGVTVMHCSMAEASWVQKTGAVRNPYYGKKMLSCGEKAGP